MAQCKPRGTSCRWIIPFSKQFALIALSHAPLPRAWRCWLLDAWLRHLYWFCMIERMAPAPGSAHSFSGQCSDAFFKLTHRVRICGHMRSWLWNACQACNVQWLLCRCYLSWQVRST